MPRQTSYPSSYTPRSRGVTEPRQRNTSANNRSRIAGDFSNVDPIGIGLGKAAGLGGNKRRRPTPYLYQDQGGGYESLLQSMEGGASSADAIQDLLANFKGTPEAFADFMEIAGPLMGGLESRRLEGSEGLAFMSDQDNWDMGAMSAYGSGAAQIGQGTSRAIRGSQQAMAAQGLGRGSARSAASSMLEQQGMGQQADLRAQMEGQASRNRMASAGQLFDAHRTIAQMALGQQITPRISSPQGSDTGINGVAGGAAAGASMGSAFGPWGTLIGGAAGAGYGAYQDRQSRR